MGSILQRFAPMKKPREGALSLADRVVVPSVCETKGLDSQTALYGLIGSKDLFGDLSNLVSEAR
jgi:hypothetical protein